MTEKIYAVVHRWEDRFGDYDTQILGFTSNEEEAMEILKREKQEVLENSPYTTMGIRDEYIIVDRPEYFILSNAYLGMDEIVIKEQEIKCRDYIIIGIYCSGCDKVVKRINLDETVKVKDRVYGCFYEFEKDGTRYKIYSDEYEDGSINTDNMWCFISSNDKVTSARVWCTFDSRIND